MHQKRMLGVAMVLGLGLTACAADQTSIEQMRNKLSGHSSQLALLEEQVKGLNAELEAVRSELVSDPAEHPGSSKEPISAEHGQQASPFEVAIAQYVLDSAGFHAMDVALNEDGALDPGFAGIVTRVHRVLSSIRWPEEMEASGQALLGRLEALRAALMDDDLGAAAPLAAEAHELQHDLSHDIDAWLGEQGGEHGHED